MEASSRLRKRWQQIGQLHPCMRHLSLALALVALHSFFLGCAIYFFPSYIYGMTLSGPIPDRFFFKQSGLFLVCLALFYMVPLLDLFRFHLLVLVAVATKVLAVLFLLGNASLTPRPALIFLTSLGDAGMALLLTLCYLRVRPHLAGPRQWETPGAASGTRIAGEPASTSGAHGAARGD